MPTHSHKLVKLGDLIVDETSGASKPLYWCRDCGSPFLKFDKGRYAVMVASWVRVMIDQHDKDDTVVILHEKPKWKSPKKTKPAPTRLGRGLSDLQSAQQKLSLDDLMKLLKTPKKEPRDG